MQAVKQHFWQETKHADALQKQLKLTLEMTKSLQAAHRHAQVWPLPFKSRFGPSVELVAHLI